MHLEWVDGSEAPVAASGDAALEPGEDLAANRKYLEYTLDDLKLPDTKQVFFVGAKSVRQANRACDRQQDIC